MEKSKKGGGGGGGERRGGRLQGLRQGADRKALRICIANWRSIYGHRTANRASLELKLITFMSGAMYHYARGGRWFLMQLPACGARTRRTTGRPAGANTCIKHDKSSAIDTDRRMTSRLMGGATAIFLHRYDLTGKIAPARELRNLRETTEKKKRHASLS